MKIGFLNFKTKNRLVLFVYEIINRYQYDKISYMSGSVAYFFTLSVFPFILFTNSIIGLLKLDAEFIYKLFSSFFPKEIVGVIAGYNDYIANISNIYVLIVSILISVYSASRGVEAVIISINSIYKTQKRRFFIQRIMISVILTIAVSIILFVFLPLTIIGAKALSKIYYTLEIGKILPNIPYWFFVIFILVVIFFIMLFLYRFAPNKKIQIKQLIPGSIFSTVATALTGAGISLYIRISSRFSLLYGSIGAFVAIMLWFYIFSNIILIGSEINRVLEHKDCLTKEDFDD